MEVKRNDSRDTDGHSSFGHHRKNTSNMTDVDQALLGSFNRVNEIDVVETGSFMESSSTTPEGSATPEGSSVTLMDGIMELRESMETPQSEDDPPAAQKPTNSSLSASLYGQGHNLLSASTPLGRGDSLCLNCILQYSIFSSVNLNFSRGKYGTHDSSFPPTSGQKTEKKSKSEDRTWLAASTPTGRSPPPPYPPNLSA